MSIIPSGGFGFASTKQFSGRSGDVSNLGGSKFEAFNGPNVKDFLVIGGLAIVGFLILKKVK